MAVERVCCSLPEGFVFQLNTSFRDEKGWYCAEWGKQAPLLFRGLVRVISVDERVFVTLVKPDGSPFAQIPVVGKESMESVLDSSRYFVIRMTEGERIAFLGIGFSNREDSFRLDSAIQAHFA